MRIEIKENYVEFYNNVYNRNFVIEYKTNQELELIKRFSKLYFASNKRNKAHNKNIEYAIYWLLVWEMTEKTARLVSDVDKRGQDFHLDHIVPISYGFKNRIAPYLIASTINLQIISKKENLKKSEFLTAKALEVLAKWNMNYAN